jgi:aryl-alcohol dehydrogenase-like predicted oxidoreductase
MGSIKITDSVARMPDFGRLVLGGNVFGWTADEKASFSVLDAFVAAGFRAIDTADSYSAWIEGHQGGESETMIGRWIAQRGHSDDLFIISKVGQATLGQPAGLRREHILRSIDGTLRRLNRDHLDVYMAHMDDRDTPIEETLGAFAELIATGRIRALGASNYPLTRFEEALRVADASGAPSFQLYQPLYNLYDRSDYELGMEPIAKERGIAILPYFGLAAGFLSGKYRGEADLKNRARGFRVRSYLNPRGLAILAALDGIATRLETTPAEVAVAWLLHRPSVTAAMVSATSVGQLTELIAAARLSLDDEALATLDAVSSTAVAARIDGQGLA